MDKDSPAPTPHRLISRHRGHQQDSTGCFSQFHCRSHRAIKLLSRSWSASLESQPLMGMLGPAAKHGSFPVLSLMQKCLTPKCNAENRCLWMLGHSSAPRLRDIIGLPDLEAPRGCNGRFSSDFQCLMFACSRCPMSSVYK